MKAAMGLLAVGATVMGVLQIPKVTEELHHFLEPTFHDSRYYEELEPSNSLLYSGLVVGALLGLAGIALAYRLWVKQPERPAAIRARLAGLHSFFVHKWYFDEVIDTLIVRPFAWFGRFGRNVFERVVVSGLFVGGRRAPSAPARPPCGPPRPASCATTRRCCCSASPRSASTS